MEGSRPAAQPAVTFVVEETVAMPSEIMCLGADSPPRGRLRRLHKSLGNFSSSTSNLLPHSSSALFREPTGGWRGGAGPQQRAILSDELLPVL